MKIAELKPCINNSWCVEKHWDAIVELVQATEQLYYHEEVKIESLTDRGYQALLRLRDAIQKMERITWTNEKSL
jgi:lipopolysaccharide biosynthesis protein